MGSVLYTRCLDGAKAATRDRASGKAARPDPSVCSTPLGSDEAGLAISHHGAPTAPPELQPSGEAMSTSPAPFRADILVVDDAPANLQLLFGMLKERGYRVRPTPTGELAMRAARAQAPDLVLL